MTSPVHGCSAWSPACCAIPATARRPRRTIYLQVWRSAANYDPTAGSPLAWLMTVAHRRAVDRVRSEQAASQRESRYGAANVEPPADHVADSVILRDERRQVTDCLGSLTDVQRECIQLAYYDGLTYVQVSERLSANLATIKSRMRDAIRGLRKCLGLRMTEPANPDLMALATPYALHAMTESERADDRAADRGRPAGGGSGIRRRGARRARDDGGRLGGDGRRAARTTARPAARPTVSDDPVRQLRPSARTRWRTTILAAAAVLAIGLGALGVGYRAAAGTPDVDRRAGVRRVRRADRLGRHPRRRDRHAGVLPREGRGRAGDEQRRRRRSPAPSTRCGCIGDEGPQSAGTMDAKAVAPSTTAVLPDLGDSQRAGFHRRARQRIGACRPARAFRRTAAGLTAHSSVAAAASASTSSMSWLRCQARRWRIAPLPYSAMRASSVRTMS